MPDYKNGKIYKLWSPEGNDIYIGSTTILLSARKAKHKYNNDCNSKILFEKYNDVRIELLECYPCETKEELAKKEGEYIRNNNCINKKISGRTKKEYDKEYSKTRNKQRITCECGGTYIDSNKARHIKSKKHQDAIGGASAGLLLTSDTA